MTKKETILRAAQEAFGELGFTAATVKDVAGRAQVSFGLVSHYFGSKQELYLAAGFDMADRLIDCLTEATRGDYTGLEAVERYMTAYFDFTEEHRRRFPILLRCSPFSHVEAGVDAAKVAEKFTIFIDELKRCVSNGIEDGTIRPLSVEETALIIYGNIVGSVRTNLLTPYETSGIFKETIKHVVRSLKNSPGQEGC
ncbi:TetR/AcrR family transcriptional regulator [Pseudodesulfovibrio portus]|uniref:TetR family transcriptional regulator n=1 Tax=Pseudodesulfovibrio portus TaxID=231439 RepID=A0ABN6RRM5_9BACT|nr:TetR/AcrR family transcriptional regulator [Pseudodesulfovibrio portus]BDQ33634.1 TetR family transcriptional regulator [Pseudodesulfovibrio portus]